MPDSEDGGKEEVVNRWKRREDEEDIWDAAS
jgi:hypothetical protein